MGYMEAKKEKMEELRMLYKDTAEEIRYFKRQQWIITNYCLAAITGIFAFYNFQKDGIPCWAKWLLIILAFVIAGVETLLQCEIQRHFTYLRHREKRIRIYFSGAFKRALLVDKRERKWRLFPIMLTVMVWIGAIFFFWHLFPNKF